MLSAPQYSIISQSNDLLTWQKYLDYISISQNWSWKEAEEKNVCIDLFNVSGWVTVNHLLIIFVKSLAVFLCFLPHFLRGLREIADLPDSMAFLLLSWNMKNSVQLSQPTQKAFHELVRNRTIHLNIVPDNNQLLWMWCSGWWRAIKRFPEMMIGVKRTLVRNYIVKIKNATSITFLCQQDFHSISPSNCLLPDIALFRLSLNVSNFTAAILTTPDLHKLGKK